MDTMSAVTSSSNSLENMGLAFQVGMRDTGGNKETYSTQPAISSMEINSHGTAGGTNTQSHHSSSGIDLLA